MNEELKFKRFHWIQYEKDGVTYIQPYAIEGEIPGDEGCEREYGEKNDE